MGARVEPQDEGSDRYKQYRGLPYSRRMSMRRTEEVLLLYSLLEFINRIVFSERHCGTWWHLRGASVITVLR